MVHLLASQQLLWLPGLLEESSCLPWPWGPSYHLLLQADVGQCWIIFNAVLFPLDSSRAPSPFPSSSSPPPPLLIHSETEEADVSALFLAPVIVTAFSSAHFINSCCDGGVRGLRGRAGTQVEVGRGQLLLGPLASCLPCMDQLGSFQVLAF